MTTRAKASSKGLEVVLVTGLQGAGKSTALHALEDMGYFCIENLPSVFILRFPDLRELSDLGKLAIAMDSRDGRFIQYHTDVIARLRKACRRFDLLFLEADGRELQRRYSVTRRRHPLDREGSVVRAVRLEKIVMQGIRRLADHIVDTSKLTPRALNQVIVDYFTKRGDTRRLEVSIQSFGFHHGTPPEADLLMDVRFLPNPHFVPRLARFNGTNSSIKQYVLGSAEAKTFLAHYLRLLNYLIPQYRREGKAYLTIAVGCTGGKHRSVVIAEEIFRRLRKKGVDCHLIHRDLED